MAHRRRKRMPAGLRRYWASRRRSRRSNPHRMQARTRTIVRYRARRSNPRRRYRNPGLRLGGFSSTDLLYMGGGALVNGIISRTGPQMLLPQYNKGMIGYALNVGFGALGAWGIGRLNRRAGQGAWIGMVVALGQRVIAENFGAGVAAGMGGLSGDLDFDLGYYASDSLPYTNSPMQGGGGPFGAFPGSPYAAVPGLAIPSASAVRAGAAAAAAALSPVGATANMPGGPQADRWASVWS